MNIRLLHDFLDKIHFISLVVLVIFRSQAQRFWLTEPSGTTAAGKHAHFLISCCQLVVTGLRRKKQPDGLPQDFTADSRCSNYTAYH